MLSTRALTYLATGALLLLAGCSAPAATSAAPAGTTTTAPAAAGTTTTTDSAKTQAPAAPGAVDKTALLKQIADAAASVKTATTTLDSTITVGGKPITTKTVMAVDQTNKSHLRAKADMTLGGAPMNMIIDGDTYYVQMGTGWFKMDKAALAKAGQKAPDTSDPGTVLGQLESQVQSADLVGDDTVDGVATKHYKLVLDGAAFSDLSGGSAEPSGLKTIPYDIWVDAGHLLRKFSMTVKADGTDVSMTGVMSKYDEPVTIEIPKDAQALPGT